MTEHNKPALGIARGGEFYWWLGIALWGVSVVLWRPEPDTPYTEAQSADTRPLGYAVFFDMVKKQAKDARRVLSRPSDLPKNVDVLVLLAPSNEVPASDRQDMLEWLEKTGGTLVIGHPLPGDAEKPLGVFAEDETIPLCRYKQLEEQNLAMVDYVPVAAEKPRDVPPFKTALDGMIDPTGCELSALLLDEVNDVVGSVEKYGKGRIIQIASADLLDNSSLGWKKTHLFAAALLDEVGRDKSWAFVESYEGIRAEPRFVQLIGASRYRPVFLQLMLVALFLYWWYTARLGRVAAGPSRAVVRDVATQARDAGEFYRRAGKSRWALSRSIEHLKLCQKTRRGASSEARSEASEAIRAAEEELARSAEDTERQITMVRKIALAERALYDSSRGKTK